MEIKQENKFKRFFKRFGAVGLACVLCLAVALVIALSIPRDGLPVSNTKVSFALPMNNPEIVKDYADDRLQDNKTLRKWEIHLSMDMASEDTRVFSIYDGVVESVKTNGLEGTVVRITHEGGFVSVYASLSDVSVSANDRVTKGQEIGHASTSAGNESLSGGHLHFTLYKDGKVVDPNNYLELQNK